MADAKDPRRIVFTGAAVVNLVGDMAGWHADADAPLAMDIEELSCAVSGFARTSQSAAMLSLLFRKLPLVPQRMHVASIVPAVRSYSRLFCGSSSVWYAWLISIILCSLSM